MTIRNHAGLNSNKDTYKNEKVSMPHNYVFQFGEIAHTSIKRIHYYYSLPSGATQAVYKYGHAAFADALVGFRESYGTLWF